MFPRLRAVIFVDGCYWHGNDCHLFKMPSSRIDFWAEKIGRNRQRDIDVRRKLEELGWRHLTVWECALKGKTRLPITDTIGQVVAWLESGEGAAEIEGNANDMDRLHDA